MVSQKKTVCISLDFEVWLFFASQQKNLSGTVNDFLKNFMYLENKQLTSKDVILQELEKQKAIIEDEQKKVFILNTKLAVALQEEQDQLKQQAILNKARNEELMVMERTLRANNDLIDLI